MKLCIVSDTHFGCRNDNSTFLDRSIDFFEKLFFPYLKENNITTVIHLGDLMDRRKFVNFHTLYQVRTRVLQRLKDEKIDFYCLLGNHDTYYKNTNQINSIRELLDDRYSFKIIDKPQTFDFEGYSIDMIPWINQENQSEILEFLRKSSSPMVCGHFELDGYQVMHGVKFEGDMTDEPLKNYELVLSGHFHSKQSKNNVRYVGTPYQITFSDVYERKGFHVFDTETRDLTFIENTDTIFEVFYYDDVTNDYEKIITSGCEKYRNKIVKVFVKNKTQPYTFTRLIDKMYQHGVYLLTVVEEMEVSEKIDEEELIDLSQDTLTLINNEIDTLTDVNNKQRLKQIISDVYMESLSI